MTSPSIFIRFITRESSKASDDKHDTARIIRNAEGDYTLLYHYGDLGVSHTMSLSDTGIFRWMRRTLNLIEADDQPIYELQIDWPMMPPVLILAKNLGQAHHTILDALEFHLDNWASAPIRPLSPPPTLLEETIPIASSPMSMDSPPYNFRQRPCGRHHMFFDTNEFAE